MTPEWEELRQLAHGTFPQGPWAAHVIDDAEDEANHNVVIVDDDKGHVCEVAWRVDGIEGEIGEYLAAVDPTTIVGLIDRIEFLESGIAQMVAALRIAQANGA